jgi:hypothetical protein
MDQLLVMANVVGGKSRADSGQVEALGPGRGRLDPATPIILAPCLHIRGRRDKPGDDAAAGFKVIAGTGEVVQ